MRQSWLDGVVTALGVGLVVLGIVVVVVALGACASPATERREALERTMANAPPPDAGAAPAWTAHRVDVVPGVPDRGRDPAVVAIKVGDGAICSGALISSRLVLTARHCVTRTVREMACPADGVQVMRDRDPTDLSILVGEDVATARRVAQGISVVQPSGVTLCDSDIAAIVLDQEVVIAKPLPVRKRGPAASDRVRAVGFALAKGVAHEGAKLLREHVGVRDVTTAEFTVAEATCLGDSGGPAIDEDTGEIIGVLARGGPSCEGKDAHNVYTRADTYAWLIEEAFTRLAEAVQADKVDAGTENAALKPAKRGTKSKPASDTGGPCASGEDCAAGVCVMGADKSYCSRPCAPGDRCPTRYHCKEVAMTRGVEPLDGDEEASLEGRDGASTESAAETACINVR